MNVFKLSQLNKDKQSGTGNPFFIKDSPYLISSLKILLLTASPGSGRPCFHLSLVKKAALTEWLLTQELMI